MHGCQENLEMDAVVFVSSFRKLLSSDGVCGLWIVCKNAHLDKHQSLLEDPQLDERHTLACQTFAGHPLQGTVMMPGMCAEGFTEA